MSFSLTDLKMRPLAEESFLFSLLGQSLQASEGRRY